MPVFVYQVLNDDGSEAEIVEIEQRAGAPQLGKHPLSGKTLRRIFQAVNIAGQHNERQMRQQLADEANLARHGFARYEKDLHTGHYHKTAGNTHAPQTLPAHHQSTKTT
ncbi:MAG: hypothetical protein LBD01_02980 [Puniceicoccales bacterium]|jgi:hypothetical protein|nr:hypothetical protein [Puniceicoccales bacterium]